MKSKIIALLMSFISINAFAQYSNDYSYHKTAANDAIADYSGFAFIQDKMFNDKFGSNNVSMEGGYSYGFSSFSSFVFDDMFFNSTTSYIRQSNKLKYGGVSYNQDFNYIMTGASRIMRNDKRFSPFIGWEIGMNVINQDDRIEDAYRGDGRCRFAWSAIGGFRMKQTKSMSILIQGGVKSTVNLYEEGAFGGSISRSSSYQAHVGATILWYLSYSESSSKPRTSNL